MRHGIKCWALVLCSREKWTNFQNFMRQFKLVITIKRLAIALFFFFYFHFKLSTFHRLLRSNTRTMFNVRSKQSKSLEVLISNYNRFWHSRPKSFAATFLSISLVRAFTLIRTIQFELLALSSLPILFAIIITNECRIFRARWDGQTAAKCAHLLHLNMKTRRL